MTAFVERIVQKLAESEPLENRVSDFVAGVLESTASKLTRFDSRSTDAAAVETNEQIA